MTARHRAVAELDVEALQSLARHVGVVTVTLAAVSFAGPPLGVAIPPLGIGVLGAGAVAAEVAPAQAIPIAVVAGAALFLVLHPVHAVFQAALVATLFACRRRPFVFASTLAAAALVLPKVSFALFHDRPGVWGWLSEPHLAATMFIAAYWWREAREGRASLVSSDRRSAISWALLFFFPTHAAYPISFGPGDLFRPRRLDLASVLSAAARLSAKAFALVALRSCLPEHRWGVLPAARLLHLGRSALWGVVALNYLELGLTLSGVADLVITIARLYGWPLPSPFRWALLAWNPVELWRRWGIYTRRFLLKTVYFPLGGSARHRLRNVLLTFTASALVLHSGWFGSRYWTVGLGGWRDYTIYFLLQGSAVCGCLIFWRLTGKDPAADRQLRFSATRLVATAATQAMSALLHVIILAQSISLGDRWRLIARCLGR